MAEPALRPRFKAGAVLSRSFYILIGNFGPFFILTAAVVLPQYLLTWAFQSDVTGEIELTVQVVVFLLVALIFELVATAVIVHAVFQSLRGRPVSLVASFEAAWRRLFPVVLVAVIQVAAIAAGFLLLIVPGLIVIVLFFVAIPCCLVERLGPLESLGRSAALTKGCRWPLFGLLVVVFIMAFGAAVLAELTGQPGDLTYKIVELLTGVVLSAFSSVIVAVAYHDLRVTKEGIDVERIAALFE